MDKMRVLIVGASETPYEDVLFEFDVALPPEYPTVPPQVYFYSMTDGLGRLNPNLYEDGRVCLSLLNTWMGEGVEVWTPKSTLLQLLVSLQALVLVKYPYYNEAGFERHRGTSEGFANALMYNERAFLLSMRVGAHGTGCGNAGARASMTPVRSRRSRACVCVPDADGADCRVDAATPA